MRATKKPILFLFNSLMLSVAQILCKSCAQTVHGNLCAAKVQFFLGLCKKNALFRAFFSLEDGAECLQDAAKRLQVRGEGMSKNTTAKYLVK